MDTLIIESFSWNPHIETAGEIATINAVSGLKTGFSFIHADNPDDCRFVHVNPLKKLTFIKKKTRIEQLQRIIKHFGVIILPEQSLSDKQFSQIENFVNNAPHNLQKLREYRYQNAQLGLCVVSSLISKTQSLEPDFEENHILIQRYLRASATVYEKSKALFLAYKPQKIISFNGRFACAKSIFEAAKSLDIDIKYHERGATYERYEIFQKQPHNFEYLRQKIKIHWQQANDNKKELAHDFYRRRRQGDGIGWKSFTIEQKKGLIPVQSSNHCQIVYYSSSDDEFAAVGDLVSHPIFQNQRHAVKSLIKWVATQDARYLTIRVHPHLQKKALADRNWWNSLRGKNVRVIPSNSEVDSYALMDIADIVIAYNSTVGVESTYWGKPSILLGDSLYSQLGCVYEPSSEREVYSLLEKDNLSALPQDKCLPYGYYFLNRGITYKYYKPDSLFSGTFLGQYLGPEPKFYRLLKSVKKYFFTDFNR